MTLQQKIEQLFVEQKKKWEQLNNILSGLDNVKNKSFEWGNDIKVNIEFNPGRIKSIVGNTEPGYTKIQKCRLCADNRPAPQEGIYYSDKYIILTNPYPVLRNHVTIPLHSHVPQLIGKKISDMLSFAEQLPDYIVFYNGAKCGASIPEHFHFQAGLKQPVLMQGENELRTCLVIESESKEEIEERFEDVYYYLKSRQPNEDEPMMNLIAFTDNNKFTLHIFPRKAHRPKQYYEQGSRQLLISPGSLDMSGLITTARIEDFEKIQKEDIEDMYLQVSLQVI